MTDAERYAVITEIKRGAEFALRDEDLSVVGRLRAITERDLDDNAVIAAMAEARTRNGRFFMSRFDVSPENKRKWLAKCVLPSRDRVIFFVQTADGDIVGQDGFTYLGDGVFELDGTMRWAPGGPRGLYVRSGVERAGICFALLDAELVVTEVLSDNVANMKNSSRMGFDLVRDEALFLSEERGVLRYELAGASSANTDRRLAVFEMTRELFAERNPAIAASPQDINFPCRNADIPIRISSLYF